MKNIVLSTRDVDGFMHEITEDVIKTLLDRGYIKPEDDQDFISGDWLTYSEAAKLMNMSGFRFPVFVDNENIPTHESPGSKERRYSKEALTNYLISDLRRTIKELKDRVPNFPAKKSNTPYL